MPGFWRHDGPVARLLSPLSPFWCLGTWIRARRARAWRAPLPVICVGNPTVGGAGKTPTALAVQALLGADGLRAGFLSRGYGGSESAKGVVRVVPSRHTAAQVGDEPLLLARAAPTWVARDRAAGARAAAAGGLDVLILDDGLQNPHLIKDVALGVIDGGYGVGNARVMPAGPLREPLRAAWRRLDAAILIGPDATGIGHAIPVDLPVLRARMVPGPEAAALKGRRVLAFAGIGRPEKFADSLRGIGAELAGLRSFPDHHPYGEAEIAALEAEAAALKADLITTAKDHVRLTPRAAARIGVLTVRLAFEDTDPLRALLARGLEHFPDHG